MQITKRLPRSIRKPMSDVRSRYRRLRFLNQWRRKTRSQIQQQKQDGQLVRLVVGAGGTEFEGWIDTDLPYMNILLAGDWRAIANPGQIDRILAEHVIEHLTVGQFRQFLRVVRPYLASDGRIRIAVPDGNHPDPEYIKHVEPNGTGPGATDHKVLYTSQLITKILEEEAYEYRLLEYYDLQHQFHKVDWDRADGPISRSADYDPRNHAKPLSYTSLIVDLWPSASKSG